MSDSKIYCYSPSMEPEEKLFCISNVCHFLSQAIAVSVAPCSMYLNNEGRDGLANLFAILGDQLGNIGCDLDERRMANRKQAHD